MTIDYDYSTARRAAAIRPLPRTAECGPVGTTGSKRLPHCFSAMSAGTASSDRNLLRDLGPHSPQQSAAP